MSSKRQKKPTQDKLVPLIRGAADEVLPFAENLTMEYFMEGNGRPVLDDMFADFSGSLADALGTWQTIDHEEEPRNHRAALIRVVSRALALLALDELNRGGRACARDAKTLDGVGNPKRSRRPAT